jgi:hypothetical protein
MLAPRPGAKKHHPRRANLGNTGDGNTGDSPRIFLGTVPAFFWGQSPRFFGDSPRVFLGTVPAFFADRKITKILRPNPTPPPLFLHNKVLVARLNGSPRYGRFKPCSFHKTKTCRERWD